jgi:U3 small nucleolar ribonucleoprotein protein IMP4
LEIAWSRKSHFALVLCIGRELIVFFRFKNIEDTIEVRHHVFVKTGFQSVELAEVGPRMSMRLFEIRAGTLDNKEGDVEWHLNQYTRTGRKKDYL